jgi:hypothetical protein
MSLSKDLSACASLFKSVCPHPSHDLVCLSLYLSLLLGSDGFSFVPLLRYVRLWPFLESARVLSHEICLSVCLHVSLPLSRDQKAA